MTLPSSVPSTSASAPLPLPPRQMGTSIGEYLFLLRRYIWLILLGMILGLAGGIFYARTQMPVFRAYGEIKVSSSSPRPIKNLYAADFANAQFLTTQSALVQSLAVKLQVVKRLGKVKETDTDVNSMAMELTKGLNVKPKPGQNIIRVTFEKGTGKEEQDKHDCEEMVNEFVQVFIEDTNDIVRKRKEEDATFLLYLADMVLEKKKKAKNELDEFITRHSDVPFYRDFVVNLRRLESDLFPIAREIAVMDAQLERIRPILQRSRSKARTDALLEIDEIRMGHGVAFILKEIDQIDLSKQKLRKGRVGPRNPKMLALVDQEQDARRRLKKAVDNYVRFLESQRAKKESIHKLTRQFLVRESDSYKKVQDILAKYHSLQDQVAGFEKQHQLFMNKLEQVRILENWKDVAAKTLGPAVPDNGGRPIRPDRTQILFIGALLGILAGAILAYIFEYSDDSIRTPEDVQQVTDVPLLGIVPHIEEPDVSTRMERDIMVAARPRSLVAEAFRTVRTNIGLSMPATNGKGGTLHLVTSAGSGEGKTTVTINVALALAQAGRRTLVVDADLRRSNIHQSMKLPNDVGLSTYLVGQTSFMDSIHSTSFDNLWACTSGPQPPNPAELLGSDQMKRFTEECRKQFDMVVFDSPPLVAVTDPVVLVPQVDGVIHVVRGNKTSKKVIRRGANILRYAKSRTLGMVLNNVNTRSGHYYYYHGYYYKGYYK